ncbi:lipoprotein [Spiroplasma endosymbiont of Colias croceus]|uniref:lipoprotein n=1 Tax=Spiroplasma endosymbiont of Colias croceus TaxID=3066310 RepID=UPI0030CF0F48
MKKLLSILGAMTLIGTTSTSVIACDGGEKPTPPTPDTRTDLSGLSDNAEITLSSSTETVADFKTALINKLKEDLKFKKLSDTEVDITKSDSTEIQNSDIVDSTLVTKVKAKSTSTNFNGEKNINVTITINDTRTDISTKIAKSINLGQLDINTVQDFLTKLQISLARMTDLNSITISDYDVFKAESTIAIQDSDITAGNSLNIKITAKGSKFQGVVDNITINYIQQKDTRTDLSTIITNKELSIIGINPEVNPTSEIIKNKTKSKNLALDINAISVSSITSTSATIIGNGKYKGNVIVNYTIDKTKKDLSMITKLTGLNINADSSTKNFILWQKRKLANEFVDKQEIFDRWGINFYDNSGNNINDKMQKHGDLYCIIFIVEKNSKWIGQTSKLKFTLK